MASPALILPARRWQRLWVAFRCCVYSQLSLELIFESVSFVFFVCLSCILNYFRFTAIPSSTVDFCVSFFFKFPLAKRIITRRMNLLSLVFSSRRFAMYFNHPIACDIFEMTPQIIHSSQCSDTHRFSCLYRRRRRWFSYVSFALFQRVYLARLVFCSVGSQHNLFSLMRNRTGAQNMPHHAYNIYRAQFLRANYDNMCVCMSSLLFMHEIFTHCICDVLGCEQHFFWTIFYICESRR